MARHLPLIYTGLSLLAGTALVCAVPPFQSPDEPAHLFRADQISRGQWHSTCQTHGATQTRGAATDCGGDIALALPESIGAFASLPYQPLKKTSLAAVAQFLALPARAEPRGFVAFNNVAIYPIVPYLPAAAAMALSSLWLGEGSPKALYAGRLASLLTLTALTALALYLAQGRPRWWLFTLALMPMTLYLSASLSADALTIGLSFVCVALGTRPTPNGISRRRWIAFVLLTVALAACKYLYALVPLAVILPAQRRFWPWAFCLAVVVAWWFAFARLPALPQPQIAHVDPPEQLHFVLYQPLAALAVLARTALTARIFLLHSFIGIFGWLDRPLPHVFYVTYAWLLAAVFLGSLQPPPVPAIGLILIVSLAAVIASAWLYSTPLGSSVIEGLQGRYFIPLAALPCLGRARLPKRWLAPVALAAVTLSLIVSLRTVAVSYYVL